MKYQVYRRLLATGLALTLAAAPALAQGKVKPLDDKDNPLLIGKRDINKGSIQFYSLDREVALGRQLAAEVDRSSRVVTDPVVSEYVNRVAQNLVLNSDAKVPFTIKVIDSNEVNAFALPGGYLYVHRGLIEAAENEAELAGVIAHEIAHVAARHGVEQASKGQLVNFASIPLIFLGGLGGFIIQQAAGLAIPLSFLKFSRGAEKEADRLGAQYMWASGYDPHALVTFFEKLQAKEKKKPGTLAKIFSTHPMNSDRIKEVQELVARFPERGEYQLSTSEFNDVKSRVAMMSAAAGRSGDDGRRPTLKRRPRTQSDDPIDSDAGSEAPDRPTLKRRSESGDPAAGPELKRESEDPDANGDGSEARERPVLRRSDGTPAVDRSEKDEAADEGRPTLKRRGSAVEDEQAQPAEEKSGEKSTTDEKSATGASKPASSSSSSSEAPAPPKLKRKPEDN